METFRSSTRSGFCTRVDFGLTWGTTNSRTDGSQWTNVRTAVRFRYRSSVVGFGWVGSLKNLCGIFVLQIYKTSIHRYFSLSYGLQSSDDDFQFRRQVFFWPSLSSRSFNNSWREMGMKVTIVRESFRECRINSPENKKEKREGGIYEKFSKSENPSIVEMVSCMFPSFRSFSRKNDNLTISLRF